MNEQVGKSKLRKKLVASRGKKVRKQISQNITSKEM